MKKAILFALFLSLAALPVQASKIVAASTCSPASQNTDDSTFPLITTDTGFEVAASMSSSSISELTAIDPSDLGGWPNYGGTYYKGGDDVWVIITPKDAQLPTGVTFKVIKPLEQDENAQPETHFCKSSL